MKHGAGFFFTLYAAKRGRGVTPRESKRQEQDFKKPLWEWGRKDEKKERNIEAAEQSGLK